MFAAVTGSVSKLASIVAIPVVVTPLLSSVTGPMVAEAAASDDTPVTAEAI